MTEGKSIGTRSAVLATLKTATTRSAQLGPIVERLVKRADPDAIILFGSRARGEDHPESDYDLCVLVPDNRRFAREAPFWLWNSVRDLGVPVDIVMMETFDFERSTDSFNSLEEAIATEGVLIYAREAGQAG